jgi:hypothetical protein
MAKKPTASNPTPEKPSTASPAKPRHKENAIERFAERVEARFFEGAEMATETTSAETNIALAALAAIEGPREPKPASKGKPANAKRKSPRPKKR